MGNHHLILGELVDFISGRTVVDTHDERYRQKIARILVCQKNYDKQSIQSARELVVAAGENRGRIKVDFCVRVEDRIALVVKYGPGSLVTRHRPGLAAARLLENYHVPLVVVTNGEDAHVLDGYDGKLLSEGLDTIPAYDQLQNIAAKADYKKISDRQADMEARIVYCFEIDGSCPCDDTTCKL